MCRHHFPEKMTRGDDRVAMTSTSAEICALYGIDIVIQFMIIREFEILYSLL